MQPSLRAATLLMIAVWVAVPAGQQPAFEAASIKPNTFRSALVRLSTSPGRLSATNVTLRMVMRLAYNLPDFRTVNSPPWMDTDRFDIEASAGNGTAVFDEIRAMTRTLLADRFKLKTHDETRDLPIYVLALARRDGRLGDAMRQATEECKPLIVP